MNPFKLVTQPFKHLSEAVAAPFRAVFIVGLCWAINSMTYSGHWWVQWVALGMGVSVVVAWARAAKTLLVLALVAWGGAWLYRRYGAQARDAFDAWVASTRPQAAQVVRSLREHARPAA